MARFERKPWDHVIGGGPDAVQLIVYGDFECPYSARGFALAQTLKQRHGQRLELVFRNFPLEHKHERALAAAIATEAASRQNRYWPMLAALFGNQEFLDDVDLRRYATALGLDEARFLRDLTDPALRARVRAEHAEGEVLGVNSTPTFFIDGDTYDGPVDGIVARVEAALHAGAAHGGAQRSPA